MFAVYFFAYNWVKLHGAVRTTLDNRITPAMAAGIAKRPIKMERRPASVERLFSGGISSRIHG